MWSKINIFHFFSPFNSKHPHKIVVVKRGRTRHRDTNRGRKQPRYVSVGFGTFVFSTRVMFSVHRWGFVAPAREENRCKFMPRFACVSRTSFSYSPAGEFVAECVLIRAIVGSRAKIDSRVALIRFARAEDVRDSVEGDSLYFSFSEL